MKVYEKGNFKVEPSYDGGSELDGSAGMPFGLRPDS